MFVFVFTPQPFFSPLQIPSFKILLQVPQFIYFLFTFFMHQQIAGLLNKGEKARAGEGGQCVSVCLSADLCCPWLPELWFLLRQAGPAEGLCL